LDDAAFAISKELKLSSDSDDSGSKKLKRGYGGVWQSLVSKDTGVR
jgi:hypothetical protein